MRPQNPCDEKHPDAMIRNLGALLGNTQDATHCVTVYNVMQLFNKHNSHNKMYTSDVQLHATELSVYHGTNVQVAGLEGECGSAVCRCIGSQSWYGQNQRNDRVSVMQCFGGCYGALNGHLPWQQQRLFMIKNLKEDEAYVEYWLALALTTIPENSGQLDPVSQYVQVRKAPAPVTLEVVNMGNIVSCAQVISKITTSSKTGHGVNERWFVNSHIDLTTWNDVYN
jgi:hypothetical protein